MTLKAQVVRVTGKTIHSIGGVVDGNVVPVQKMPDAAWVEIEVMDDGSCSLYRYDSTGDVVGDTWHETLEEAKGQARFEYDIADGDWT
jgi:hypothetical protein